MGAFERPQLKFSAVNRFSLALLHGLAGRLTAKNGGFRPGQWASPSATPPARVGEGGAATPPRPHSIAVLFLWLWLFGLAAVALCFLISAFFSRSAPRPGRARRCTGGWRRRCDARADLPLSAYRTASHRPRPPPPRPRRACLQLYSHRNAWANLQSWADFSLIASCVPTGTHGPTRITWATLTPYSRFRAARAAAGSPEAAGGPARHGPPGGGG